MSPFFEIRSTVDEVPLNSMYNYFCINERYELNVPIGLYSKMPILSEVYLKEQSM